jgi:hypothetical protein
MKQSKFSKYRKYYLIFGVYGLLTLCVIYFSAFIRNIAFWILQLDRSIDTFLAPVLNTSAWGIHLRHILALVLTPLVIVAIPTGIYWLMKKKLPPYLVQAIWVLWIIAALSRLLSQ